MRTFPNPRDENMTKPLTAMLFTALFSAGSYFGRSADEREALNERLRALHETLRSDYGYEENKRENTSGVSYLSRGYATYESMVWPKPGYCQELANDTWVHTGFSAEFNHTTLSKSFVKHNYKADNAPSCKCESAVLYQQSFQI